MLDNYEIADLFVREIIEDGYIDLTKPMMINAKPYNALDYMEDIISIIQESGSREYIDSLQYNLDEHRASLDDPSEFPKYIV